MQTRISAALVLILSLCSSEALAQRDLFPCENPNEELYNIFENGSLERLYVHGCQGVGLDGLSTSILMPSGTPPNQGDEGEDNEDLLQDTPYESWTCRYSAGNLQDGDPATAWVEGKDGQGLGEVIIIPCLDLSQPVEIWSGYGKSKNLFQFNSRPKEIEIAILDTNSQIMYTQYGNEYLNLKVVKKGRQTLEDLNGYQSLYLPTLTDEYYTDENITGRFLAIKILSVYPGSKWEDTCISEVRNVEKD
ncbi:MAG TPA: hypothetical protein DCE41_23030 [Cytophagales bacterium]|nr:hypothetical protein [Cytophagales bacterium]HAA23812.1 hypothetical protein [Cytophagales bacterium]HAP59318.1 hypothetical protein [Cytophagales bacterium]